MAGPAAFGRRPQGAFRAFSQRPQQRRQQSFSASLKRVIMTLSGRSPTLRASSRDGAKPTFELFEFEAEAFFSQARIPRKYR